MTKLISPRIFFGSGQILDLPQLAADSVFELLGQGLKDRLGRLLEELGVGQEPVIQGEVHPQAIIEGPVFIAEGAQIGPTAYIQGPCYIGRDAEVRHGAFIRGTAIIGDRAVVGHATEVKGSIFGEDAKAGHFAYVGDSLLGSDVNLGAGTKLANLKLRGTEVQVKHPETGERTAHS